jgi:transketolase
MIDSNLEARCINTLRFLSADVVEKARSGHPGAPMGMAVTAHVLWDRFLSHNPRDPRWPNRDRFVLSAGHASMLLYSLLHLTGYDLPLEEIRQFRQWGSRTPGHPEFGHTPGVEMTTGPLGQGFASGVGMALAERALAAQFNRPGHEIIDHYTYAIVSDGDLQEGISGEAASLAGHLGLGKLIYLYDDNQVQIDGPTSLAFSEDVARRFEAYRWQVIGPIDGMDGAEVESAIRRAQAETSRPSLVICRTIIGYGSPTQGTAKTHGEPLGADNLRAAKQKLGWPLEPMFHIPDDVLDHMRQAVVRGQNAQEAWTARLADYARAFPELAVELKRRLSGALPEGWDKPLATLFDDNTAAMATRDASGKVINALAATLPLIGGSADLSPSNKTLIAGQPDHSAAEPGARNLRFGVREHAMAAIASGIALHGGFVPYVATFLTFSDYMRPAIRLAALMGLRVIYVFTHDSIGLGEDGPTHQPIEHLLALRAVPNLTVIRPCDPVETAEAWRSAIVRAEGPTALILTRQKVPTLKRAELAPAHDLQHGAYTLWQSHGDPELILIGTGSEVSLALAAGRQLAAEGIAVRVVAMPSWESFDAQPDGYRAQVLPPHIRARVAVEAGGVLGWERYVGLEGAVIGMRGYGASAPDSVLYDKFGITTEQIVARARALLGAAITTDNRIYAQPT